MFTTSIFYNIIFCLSGYPTALTAAAKAGMLPAVFAAAVAGVRTEHIVAALDQKNTPGNQRFGQLMARPVINGLDRGAGDTHLNLSLIHI